MWCGTFSGIADVTDDFSTLYLLALTNIESRHVAIQGFVTIAMIHNDIIAISPVAALKHFNIAIPSCVYLGSGWCLKINSFMEFDRLVNRVNPVAVSRANST